MRHELHHHHYYHHSQHEKSCHAGEQRCLSFREIPIHLDRDRVDNWYMKTLDMLGILPTHPSCDHSHNNCDSHCHNHNHHCHVKDSQHECCCHETTHKSNDHYLFICHNNRCQVDTFVARERNLNLAAINPLNINEKMYTTKCKCGMTCVSTQIVDVSL